MSTCQQRLHLRVLVKRIKGVIDMVQPILSILSRANAFQVYAELSKPRPLSVIRLGDADGALLGYPELTGRAEVDRYLKIYLGSKNMSDELVMRLAKDLRNAVKAADVVGLPRAKQIAKHPMWAMVDTALEHYGLLVDNPVVTDAALHRLMQFALLYRPLVARSDFLGLVSCRRVADKLGSLFGCEEIGWYGVRGDLGDIHRPHYPDGYELMRERIRVPGSGSLFLVGAGWFGRIYCQWIKERGGRALDIGSMFDSWAGLGRVGRGSGIAVRSLDVYRKIGSITRTDAVNRYNQLIDSFDLDSPKVAQNASYLSSVPDYW